MSVREQDNKYAIDVTGMIRVHRLYEEPIDRLKESMSISHKSYHRDFYALNQPSFRVGKGETVGIIGTSSPGKPTILEIIIGVLTPATGGMKVGGKISVLLELGVGSNMDYAGIENIYMNGTMMGYTKKEMDAKLQDILEFTEVGDFVCQPVKTYFSGMFVRLTFALAINVDPEILTIDEALSVDDVFFQSKRYHRIEGIRQEGTTILMVTHDIGSIIKYYGQVVLLNKGEFIAEGLAGRVVDMYKKILAGQLDSLKAGLEWERQQKENLSGGNGQEDTGNGQHTRAGARGKETARNQVEAGTKPGDAKMPDFSDGIRLERGRPMKDRLTINYNRTKYGDGRAEVVNLGPFDERGNITNFLLKGEMFTIKERIHFSTEIRSPVFAYAIKDKKGAELIDTNTVFESADIQPVKRGDEYVVEFTQKMTLQGREYLLSMSCTGFEQDEHVVYHRPYNVANITVIPSKNMVGVYDIESKVKAEEVEAENTQAGSARPIVNGGL